MNKVVKILMNRDGLDEKEAKRLVDNFLADAEDYISCGDLEGIEDLLMDELGLEPDYIPDLLGIF